jgi:hypothetical protein
MVSLLSISDRFSFSPFVILNGFFMKITSPVIPREFRIIPKIKKFQTVVYQTLAERSWNLDLGSGIWYLACGVSVCLQYLSNLCSEFQVLKSHLLALELVSACKHQEYHLCNNFLPITHKSECTKANAHLTIVSKTTDYCSRHILLKNLCSVP